MSEQIAQEPTMEEILASIRRIISEDEAPADTRADAPDLHAVEPAAAMEMEPQAEPEEEDVLELNQPYEPEPAPAMDDIETAPRFEAEAFHAEPEYEEPAPAYTASFQAAPADVSGLVDEPVAHSVASAFASLSMNLALPREGRTLEDLVKELMYPILRDWLNQNLPSIVEAQVRAEVDRLSRLRGLR
jgi:cell pole-organizing protein PopZ